MVWDVFVDFGGDILGGKVEVGRGWELCFLVLVVRAPGCWMGVSRGWGGGSLGVGVKVARCWGEGR